MLTLKTRICVLDQANIGTDLDYAPLAAVGEVHQEALVANGDVADFVRGHFGPPAGGESRVLVANRTLFPRPVLEACRDARVGLVCLTATGTNTVDLAAAADLGIGICNIVGYSTTAVAQHTFALVLDLLNKAGRFHQRSLSRDWVADASWTWLGLPIHELAGRTWGILGMGAIGRQVAHIAEAFGCRVQWASLSGTARKEAWDHVDLDVLLAGSDVVSIHAPMRESTMGLLDYHRLGSMKPGAILVNVGRGGIIVEADLARILHEGHLGGAGIDVLWPEPPAADHPLLDPVLADHLVLTPHVAWAAVEARQRALAETAQNMEDWLRGGRRNRVEGRT